MTDGSDSPLTELALARDLHELISAIDRRLPQIERAGELEIARDAAALRERALSRLSSLRPLP
jgi:hypothetical protein